MARARPLTLEAGRLRYTLRQRKLPSFIGPVGAMFSTSGGYLMPMCPPKSCKAAAWQPEAI
jgi:hypothetical protein